MPNYIGMQKNLSQFSSSLAQYAKQKNKIKIDAGIKQQELDEKIKEKQQAHRFKMAEMLEKDKLDRQKQAEKAKLDEEKQKRDPLYHIKRQGELYDAAISENKATGKPLNDILGRMGIQQPQQAQQPGQAQQQPGGQVSSNIQGGNPVGGGQFSQQNPAPMSRPGDKEDLVGTKFEQGINKFTGERTTTPKDLTSLSGTQRVEEVKIRIKKLAELSSKLDAGKLVSGGNTGMVSQGVYDLSEAWMGAYEEGGAGGIIQAGIAGAANKFGDVPNFIPVFGGKEIGGKFSESGAYKGRRRELIFKLMPMLTQQGTKSEGSVRLITSVLDAIGESIPELSASPRTARRQLEATIRSFYRFARAAEALGMDFEKAFTDANGNLNIDKINPQDFSSWAKRVWSQKDRIKIKGDELEAFNALVKEAVSPFDRIPRLRDKKSTFNFDSIKTSEDILNLTDEELRQVLEHQ